MTINHLISSSFKKLFAVTLLAAFCLPVWSQISDEAMHYSVVRIEVQNGSKTSMASGFVWQEQNLAITSLHAIRRKPATITVICRDVPYKASVEKVLRDADLVLLKTEKPMTECAAIKEINPNKPASKTPLTAFGFKPDVSASTPKDLKKYAPSSEKLKSLITDDMIVPMQRLNMPSLDLDVYFVTGTIYKGYSGGPVMDTAGYLVGIVEGGLDKGLSDHNWLIPAKNINRLMASPQVDDIPADLNEQDYFFSAVLTKRSAPENYIEFEDINNSYRWIKTKTRSFEQLRQTSETKDGLDQLWATMLPEIETSAEENVMFDIYEEETLGIVIAVPAGNKLQYVEENGDWSMFATDSLDEQAFIKVRHGAYQYTDDNGKPVTASHDDFIEYAIDEDLDCQAPIVCEMQNDHFRIVNFGQGNKIFRAGYQIEDPSDQTSAYRYINRIVRGDDVLIVETLVNLGEDSALSKCFDTPSAQNCGQPFWEPASFMLAAALSSFSSLSVEGIEPIVYTPENDEANENGDSVNAHPSLTDGQAAQQPASISYLNENGEIVFLQFEDNSWFINIDGEPQKATLQGLDTLANGVEYYLVNYADNLYAIPTNGGVYLVSQVDTDWFEGESLSIMFTGD